MSEVNLPTLHALLRQIKGLSNVSINQLINLDWSTLEQVLIGLFDASALPDISAFINQRQTDRAIERSKPTPASLAAARDRELLYRKLLTELVHGHVQSINQSNNQSRPLNFDPNEPDILINQPKLALRIIQSITNQVLGITESAPVNPPANQSTNQSNNQPAKQPAAAPSTQPSVKAPVKTSTTRPTNSRPSSEESKVAASKLPGRRTPVNGQTASSSANQSNTSTSTQSNGPATRTTGIPPRQSAIRKPINQSINPPPSSQSINQSNHISALDYDPSPRRSDLDQLSDARSTQSVNQASRISNNQSNNQSNTQSIRNLPTSVKTLQEELLAERAKTQSLTTQFHQLEDSIRVIEVGGPSESRSVTMLAAQVHSLRRQQSINQSMYHMKRNVLAEVASTLDVLKETGRTLRGQLNQSNNQSNNQSVTAEDILSFRNMMSAVVQTINQCSSTIEDSVQRAHSMDLYNNNQSNNQSNDQTKRRTKAVVHTQEWQT